MNLSSLLGLSMERAKAAISRNCRTLLTNGLRKKQFYKETIKVEEISSAFDSKEAWHDLLKWDPLSSGEGDLLLDDMAKSFSASSKMSKIVKAIDFASAIPGMPSHVFQVKDLISANKACSLSLDVNKNPISSPEAIEPTAACHGSERSNRLDVLPALDQASLSDTPTTYLIFNKENFQEINTLSTTAQGFTVNEKIKTLVTATQLDQTYFNGSISGNLFEVKTHDSHSDKGISRELNVVLPDQNKKLSASWGDAESDKARNMDGKVEIVTPSAELQTPNLLDDNSTKTSDVNLSTRVFEMCEAS